MRIKVQKLEDGLGIAPPAPDIKLVVWKIPPSSNEYLRMHWAVKKRLRSNFAWLLKIAAAPHILTAEKMAAHVQITIFSNAPKATGGRARRLDYDNLYGGVKPLLDAMKDIRLIVNDSPKWLDPGVSECRDPVESPRTEISITYGEVSR
jgi:Holliday junction resolvase RusA-like endonuclease